MVNYYQQQKLEKRNRKVKRNVLIGLILVASLSIFAQYVYLMKDMNFKIPEVQAQENISVRDYAWNQAKKAGLDPVHLVMILEGESNFNPEAIGVNNNKTVDIGVAQWNSIHKNISLADKLNPYKSIDLMIAHRLKTGNYNIWVAAQKFGITK